MAKRKIQVRAPVELEITVMEDLGELCSLLLSPLEMTNAKIRNSSTTLRRLLINRDLQKVANGFGGVRLVSPNNKPIVRANERTTIPYFQSGGANALGIFLHALLIEKGSRSQPIKDYHPEQTVLLSIEGFLRQPVICFDGQWVTREDVLKYVANKAGGAHFDQKRGRVEQILDKVRNVIDIFSEGDTVALHFRSTPEDVAGEFTFRRHRLDPVFFEFLSAIHFLCQSPEITDLKRQLEQRHP